MEIVKTNGANVLMGVEKGHFDGHAHVFSANTKYMIKSRRYTPDYGITAGDYLNQLRLAKLNGGILIQPSFLGTNNQFLLNALRELKKLKDMAFRGVVMLNPEQPLPDIKGLHAEGIIGMRLNLVGQTYLNPGDISEWKNLFKQIDAIGWHVELHCEGYKIAPILDKLLHYCRHVVIDHFGLPDADSPLSCKGQSAILKSPKDRVFLKASAPYRVFPFLPTEDAAQKCSPLFNRFLEQFGLSQILWGSDFPWTQFESGKNFAQTLNWLNLWLPGKKSH